MLTEALAPYMLWAKTRTPAEIDLAGSNLLSCTVEDLPGAREALQLTAPNDNGFAPVRDAIAAHVGVPESRVVTATGIAPLTAPSSRQCSRLLATQHARR